MLKKLSIFFFVTISLSCTNVATENTIEENAPIPKPTKILETPLPKGFERLKTDTNSFGYYLQHLHLKKDNTVYYYDGVKKANQDLHYAVLDIPVPKNDLQQCADAIMRLSAEYFFARKEYSKIEFKSSLRIYNFQQYLRVVDIADINKAFESFLEMVFTNCGTYNLSDMLHTKQNINDIQIGDVFVKGGSPGHAMIVVDVAINIQTKERIYMLAQSFMPAQSIHIVINPNDKKISPWYKVEINKAITTPGYIFSTDNLKCW
jgi:hypothetical protein